MAKDTAATLANTQAVFSVPLGDEALLCASVLNHGAIFSVEETLPTDVQTVGEIAYVHQPKVLEFLSHCRIELLINLAAIHDRGAPALLGSDHAEETDACGP